MTRPQKAAPTGRVAKALASGGGQEQTRNVPQRRQATRRFLATVLFTDIVGSTERAAELGDRAWRTLLERHHAAVRRELRAFHGREMGTAGDGFFALFEAPEHAVRCAEAIVTAVGSLGLQVRAGVHTGECEAIGGEIGGMAVHIGSRVAALAGPDEVLVTGSVRDLMTGSDRQFGGGDPHDLKGVTEPWRIYRLVPEPLNGDQVSSRRLPMVPLYTRRRRRSIALSAGIVVALALSTVGYVVTGPGPLEEVVVGENAVGVIGPGDPPRFAAAVPVGRRPTGMASGFGSVWVTNSTDDSVSRIDPRTLTAVAIPVGPPGSSPSGVAVGAGAVWVANSGNATVTRLDPTTSRPTQIPVQPGPTGIVVAFGSVWVTNALDASVTEIDPDTSTVEGVVPVGAGPTGIAAGAGYLWVTNQGDGTVTRFDPGTSVPDSPVKVGDGPVGIAVRRDAAWVTDSLDGSLSRIDVDTLNVTARTLSEDGGAYGVVTRGRDVWVSNEYAGSLMRVTAEPDFRLSRTVPVGGAPLGLAYVGDNLWFTNTAGGGALHRGGVLTMVGPGVVFPTADDPAVLDPTVGYDPASWRLTFLAHDGLVGLRRAGGVRGANIVADLATSLPKPTDGGLTYTFHLRKGIRYSTGAPVLAGDIRRGIERTIMNGYGAGFYYRAIVGGRACAKAADAAVEARKALPDCDLSKGIVADDRTGTISFHLRKPVPEFIYQLSLLSGVAVPQDTPTELRPGEFLPATGPYVIDSYLPKGDAADGHGRLTLVRNRYFREWSSAAQPAGYPDRIVLDTGYTDQEGTARVIDGRADLLWFGVTDGDVDRLRGRYPSQTHTNPGAFVGHVFLNTTKPPFDNADARRALAFALDRRALADLSMGQPTCQLVPPDFPAHKPFCPFTVRPGDGRWTGPNLAAADRLAERSKARGAKVRVVVHDGRPFEGTSEEAGRRVVATLDRLGFDASLRVLTVDDFFEFVFDPKNPYNAGLTMWGADYPAASQYVAAMGACDGTFNIGGLCDRALTARMSETTELQLTDLAAANDAWADLDRAVVRDAAVIPFSTIQQQDFVSHRVGNLTVNPLYGPLVAQMWVR